MAPEARGPEACWFGSDRRGAPAAGLLAEDSLGAARPVPGWLMIVVSGGLRYL